MMLFQKHKINAFIIKFFIDIESFLCITAHTADGVKHQSDFITMPQIPVNLLQKLCPFWTVYLRASECFFVDGSLRIFLLAVGYLPIYALSFSAYSCIKVSSFHVFFSIDNIIFNVR